MKNKGFGFWFSLYMAGEALTKVNKSSNKQLFEDYDYTNPFTMPRLQHPFWGNTFKYHKTKSNNKSKAENLANSIASKIYDMENIELIPVSIEQGSNNISIKFVPYNCIKKSFSLQRQIKYAVGNENTRIYPDGDKIVVEIPHKGDGVLFGDFMYDTNYRLNKSKTVVPIGQNEKGENIYGDIAKMPHMLVAGTTGSGKSVFLNGIITSLLMKNSPNDLRMILIDPKMVEFSRFSPLRYVKYVSETSEAVDILSRLCKEMDRRYDYLAKHGCRDIDGYNKKNPSNKMPRIVLVVDEMADMMENKAYSKKVESNIVIIAQKARACGIHMILATQRPTVKVMSGLIKANIPCRVALKVMTKMDSMVILDKVGAELLNGYGDMLYLDGAKSITPIRLQGGMLTETEIDNVVLPLVKENQPRDWEIKYKNCEADMPEAMRKEFIEYYE